MVSPNKQSGAEATSGNAERNRFPAVIGVSTKRNIALFGALSPQCDNLPHANASGCDGGNARRSGQNRRFCGCFRSALTQRDIGKAIIAYLPGTNYGTPQDEQVLVARTFRSLRIQYACGAASRG